MINDQSTQRANERETGTIPPLGFDCCDQAPMKGRPKRPKPTPGQFWDAWDGSRRYWDTLFFSRTSPARMDPTTWLQQFLPLVPPKRRPKRPRFLGPEIVGMMTHPSAGCNPSIPARARSDFVYITAALHDQVRWRLMCATVQLPQRLMERLAYVAPLISPFPTSTVRSSLARVMTLARSVAGA